jgi:sporulation protein YlmC with PRC-barrel domain
MNILASLVAISISLVLVTGAAAQQPTSPSDQSQSSPSPSAPSSSQPPASGVSGSAASSQGDVLVDASSIIGATVRSQGKDIGKVDRLMLDPRDGRVRTVVVKIGGALGMGSKTASLPWESVKVGQDGGKIVVSAEQQLLDQAPSASPSSQPRRDDKNRDKNK